MNAESGFCYVVLYSNGFIKGGKSRDVFKRYKTHKATATALGISVKKAFYTEPHPTYHANEKRLLSALAAASEERVGEFFRGATEDSAIEALISLGLGINAIEERIFGMSQETMLFLARGKLEEAAKANLGTDTYRVLFAVLSVVDFENWIQFNQAEMADNIGMRRQNFGRAMRKLESIELLQRGPKVGRSVTYRINPSFGWKGSAKNHLKAIDSGLKERMKASNMSVVEGSPETAAN